MSSKSLRIVIAEDDPIICWHLDKLLSYLPNAEKIFFETQSEVENHIDKHVPDIVIVNLRLLKGWVNLALLNSLKSLDCQIIILTGLRDERLQPELSYRADYRFLYKPFTKNQLRNCVEASRTANSSNQ